MAFPLPPLIRAVWRRQILWSVALAIGSVACLSGPASALTPSEVVQGAATTLEGSGQTLQAQTARALPQLQQTARTTVDTTVSNVQGIVADATAQTPVAPVVERVREPVAAAPAAVDDTVPPAAEAQRPAAPQPRHGGSTPDPGGAIGAPGSVLSGAAVNAHSAALTAAEKSTFAHVAEAPHSHAVSSAPARSGGQDAGHEDGPVPGGPGATTGGLSGPVGFVLIAAVLAAIVALAPRMISTPLRMSPSQGRPAALLLPIEWPD